MNCGERIRKLRESKNMSVKSLAREAGVTAETVESWESGTSLPETGKLLVLAAILGTSAEYLDKGTEPSAKKDTKTKSKSRLLFSTAMILYFAGYLMGLFPQSIVLGGTPLFYYGTSPVALLLLVSTLIAVILGVVSGFHGKNRR